MLKLRVKVEDAVLQRIRMSFDKYVDRGIKAAAKKGAELVRRGIETGRSEWPELSQVTINIKGHDQILFDTGDMYNSIDVDKEGIGRYTYFTDVPYADIHELGLLLHATPSVPRREFFMPTTQGNELQEIIQAAKNEIISGVR